MGLLPSPFFLFPREGLGKHWVGEEQVLFYSRDKSKEG